MNQKDAIKLLDNTFSQEFDMDRFANFIKELFNHFKFKKNFKDRPVPLSTEYQEYIEKLYSLGTYHYLNRETIEVFAVKLKRDSSVGRARTMQRNSIANYLKKYNRNASLVAFYGDNPDDWRFSFVKVDYELFKDKKGNLKVDEKLTPAKRYSFLVGKNESNHTCKSQFLPLIKKESEDPNLEEIENTFSVEKVTKEFFDNYRELYLRLNESLEEIIEKDPIIKVEFEEKSIIAADFAKKLMGQIVFIYFLQKKGWLGVEMDQEWGTGPKNFLRTLYDKKSYDNFFNDVLEYLFYDALATDRYDDYYEKFECRIPFLNGGLFEPINMYNWRKTDITIDNDIFGDILNTFDRFNFTIKEDEPLERTIAVDPEMLGKVFENLLEVKDRKSKGAFYTPREVVHYICKQCLINYLDSNSDIPKDDLESFIKLGDFALDSIIRAKELRQSSKMYALPESIKTNYELIDKLLYEVKILDPAVGSGAFLVGMMNEILKAKSILSLLKDENTINYDIKRQIIENSLYGVDLDSSAVDVTKLRFWLSLIVDEEDIINIKPLPNLDHKIMCGNSLIDEYDGIKLFDEKIFLESPYEKKELIQSTLFDERLQESHKKLKYLKKLHKLYFNEQNKKQKDHYRLEIEKIEWDFIEETLKEVENEKSLEKLRNYKKTNSKPFFLWKLYFSEVFQRKDPGFDIVVANPPYIRIQTLNYDKDMVKYFNNRYKSAIGNYDIYNLFVEKSMELVKDKYEIGFILPNKFILADYGKGLRKIINDSFAIRSIINFKDNQIFEGASTYTCLLFLTKGNKQFKYSEIDSFNKLEDAFDIIDSSDEYDDGKIRIGLLNCEKYLKEPWKFYVGKSAALIERLNEIPLKLEDIVEKIFQGLATSADKIYIVESSRDLGNLIEVYSQETQEMHLIEREVLKKVIKGKETNKYGFNYNGKYLIFPYILNDYDFNLIDPKTFEEKYPHAWNYLKFNEKKIRARERGKMDHDKWYAFTYPKSMLDYRNKKIMTPNSAFNSSFAYDTQGEYYTTTGVAGGFALKLKENTGFNEWYLLAILNSSLMNFLNKKIGKSLQGGFYSFEGRVIKNYPLIPLNEDEQQIFIQKSMDITELVSSKISESKKFKKQLREEIHYESKIKKFSFSKKLDKYYELGSKEFLKELKKKKLDISPKNREKLIFEFNESKNKIVQLNEDIERINNELDEMVYKLYDLTEEEIQIIKDSLNN